MNTGTGGINAVVENSIKVIVTDDKFGAGGKFVITCRGNSFFKIISTVVKTDYSDHTLAGIVGNNNGFAGFGGQCTAVSIIVNFYNSNFVSVGSCIINFEFCAGDKVILAIGFYDIEFKSFGCYGIFRSFVVNTIAEDSIVGVGIIRNDCFFGDFCGIGNNYFIVGFKFVAERLNESDFESAGIAKTVGYNFVIGDGNDFFFYTGTTCWMLTSSLKERPVDMVSWRT